MTKGNHTTMLQTEHEFTLPNGYVDSDGNLHKHGVMRLATAADEIVPLKDARVQRNSAYFVVILLSRVVTQLGEIEHITPKVIESLFAEDFAFLESLYNHINGYELVQHVACPHCQQELAVESNGLGG